MGSLSGSLLIDWGGDMLSLASTTTVSSSPTQAALLAAARSQKDRSFIHGHLGVTVFGASVVSASKKDVAPKVAPAQSPRVTNAKFSHSEAVFDQNYC